MLLRKGSKQESGPLVLNPDFVFGGLLCRESKMIRESFQTTFFVTTVLCNDLIMVNLFSILKGKLSTIEEDYNS